jgi:hypothetical protein
MKKSLLFLGLSVLMTSATFVSCSKNDVFEANKATMEAAEKDEYRSYYEEKYGKIDSNQSWDFTNFSNTAKTRASGSVVNNDIDDPELLQTSLHNDKGGVKSSLDNTGAVSFNPNVLVNIYPGWCYNESLKNLYVQMTVQYNGVHEEFNRVQIKNKAWWGNNGATASSNKGVGVNTMGLTGVSWKANILNNNKEVIGSVDINSYKVVTVNGRTYWCFDIPYDSKNITLIYLVLPRPLPVGKRYLIEDLGSKRDFDFNDIVVDVIQDESGNQKAIIRAMGGKLDFTLKIGNTTWIKGKDGAALGYDVDAMYNTDSPDYTKKLAEFPVSGWYPDLNNVSVEVESMANQDVIIQIPFPRKGEAPMIIALNTYVDWQTERTPLPDNWWKPITNEE